MQFNFLPIFNPLALEGWLEFTTDFQSMNLFIILLYGKKQLWCHNSHWRVHWKSDALQIFSWISEFALVTQCNFSRKQIKVNKKIIKKIALCDRTLINKHKAFICWFAFYHPPPPLHTWKAFICLCRALWVFSVVCFKAQ